MGCWVPLARASEMQSNRPTILFKLASELHRLLQVELSCARYRENRLAAALLLTLSRPFFRRELLFRDFDLDEADLWLLPAGMDAAGEEHREDDPRLAVQDTGSAQRVFKPALVYFTQVLGRRLTLANNLGEKPTNMHLLLGELAAHGPQRQGWPSVQVKREPRAPSRGRKEPLFAHVARTLSEQIRRLGTAYGAISARRRAAHGPIWLSLPDCSAEVAEELTLWDCLAAQPTPIERSLDEASRIRLARVLESLNERYGLLRGCGLDPELWNDDQGLSIARLRSLQGLRRRARRLLGEPAEGWSEQSATSRIHAAYARVFAELQDGGRPVAGFDDFDDFARSEVGEQMLHRGRLSLNEPLPLENGDPQSRPPDTHALIEREDAFLDLFERCPRIRRDRVLDYFLRETLIGARNIHGNGGLLQDAAFRRLVDASSRYAGAGDEALLNQLERDLAEAIRHCKGLAP
jgi:hypothetical protein